MQAGGCWLGVNTPLCPLCCPIFKKRKRLQCHPKVVMSDITTTFGSDVHSARVYVLPCKSWHLKTTVYLHFPGYILGAMRLLDRWRGPESGPLQTTIVDFGSRATSRGHRAHSKLSAEDTIFITSAVVNDLFVNIAPENPTNSITMMGGATFGVIPCDRSLLPSHYYWRGCHVWRNTLWLLLTVMS